MRAERTKSSFFPSEPLRMLPIVFMSLFAVMVAVDATIALQPAVLRPLRDSFQHWIGSGAIAPSWASLFATGIAVGGIAIAASLLSVFIRGVQTAPYVWLAPIVVGSGAAVMVRLHAELPVPISVPAFALLSGCALLGGGALLRQDSFATRFTAGLVLSLPLLLLAIGYSQGAASHDATQFIFVLVLTTFVTVVLAYATREKVLGDSSGQGEQLVELLERARTAEARATFAEQQLASSGYGSFAVQSPRLFSDDDELARMRGGSSGHVMLWAAILFLTGSLATGYFAGYLPLQNRMDAQRKLAQTNDEQHVKALTALRSGFDSERSALEARLRAAQAAQAEVVAASVKTPASTEAQQPASEKTEPVAKQDTKQPALEAKKVEPKKAEPAPPQAAESHAPAKAKAAATAVHARVASTHAAPPARSKKISARAAASKPAAAKPAAAAAAKAHYDDETLDDDPIGGL